LSAIRDPDLDAHEKTHQSNPSSRNISVEEIPSCPVGTALLRED
jgi:hypothetical protein